MTIPNPVINAIEKGEVKLLNYKNVKCPRCFAVGQWVK